MALRATMFLLLVCWAMTFGTGEARESNFPTVNIQVPQVSCRNATALGILCDVDAVDDSRGTIQMTTEFHNSTGYVLYRQRIPMLDRATKRSVSFSSNFTFRMTRRNGSGDGMAFFMVGNASYRGWFGSTFGVYRWNDYNQSIFSIEYDTYFNQDIDPKDDHNHVGVDFKDIYSRTTGNAGEVGINLLGGYPVTTWIDYDSVAKKIEVRIANGTSSAVKPVQPLVWTAVDLSQIVEEYMTLGIAASSGEAHHELLSMSLATSFPPEAPKHGIGTGAIIGIVAGAIFAAAVLGLGLWWLSCGNGKLKFFTSHDEFKMDMDVPFRFSYQQLKRATNEFSDSSSLGQGSSSSVYRGVIPGTGQEVAVKKVTSKSKKGEKQFLAEIKVVSRLRHRNLVKLLGWCSDRGNYLLVYELMPNGSLDKHLYDVEENGDLESKDVGSARSESTHSPVLSWSRRSAIVRGVAAGLTYLHDEYAQRVIHRDIKSSNVMLDEEFNARLGDFGLARFIDHSSNLTNTQLAGTIGYIAPEVILTWKSTDKTDVYAFGILLLEIVCARRPIEPQVQPEEMILIDWVWNLHSEQKILKAVDPRLESDFPAEEVTNVLLVGLLCCHPDPEQRPSIRQVQQYLAGDVSLPAVPSVKPIFHNYSSSRLHQRQRLRQGSQGSKESVAIADEQPPISPVYSSSTNNSMIWSDPGSTAPR